MERLVKKRQDAQRNHANMALVKMTLLILQSFIAHARSVTLMKNARQLINV